MDVLLIAGIGFGAVGFVDDLTGALPITIRLALQFAAAAAVVAILWTTRRRECSQNSWSVQWRPSGLSHSSMLSTSWTASTDLVRGNHRRRRRDRIARPPRTPTRLQAAAFALVAGAIGFAPFNFPTARVFLGDVGSYFAGAWLAVLVVLGLRGSIPPEAIVAPVALYVADTGLTLARRVQRHEPWHEPHRQHAYQRLWSSVEPQEDGWGRVHTCDDVRATWIGEPPRVSPGTRRRRLRHRPARRRVPGLAETDRASPVAFAARRPTLSSFPVWSRPVTRICVAGARLNVSQIKLTLRHQTARPVGVTEGTAR